MRLPTSFLVLRRARPAVAVNAFLVLRNPRAHQIHPLAQDGAIGSEEQVLYQLLRNGGSSANVAALEAVFGGDSDLLPIESMMLVEARVFRGDDGMLEMERDLAERNEFVSFVIGRAVNPGLPAALHVDGGGGWVDPAGGDKD